VTSGNGWCGKAGPEAAGQELVAPLSEAGKRRR
jgi:hypothetical protein